MKEIATITCTIGILICAAVYLTMSGQLEPKMDDATGDISGKMDDHGDIDEDFEERFDETEKTNVVIEESESEELGDEESVTDELVDDRSIDDMAGQTETENELLAVYKGCYKDADARTFEYPSGSPYVVENHDIAKCIEYCMQGEYHYMGLQFDKECFCGNNWNKIISLGPRNPDEGQCGMHQKNTAQYNAYGSWGGLWTNAVYDISGNYITEEAEGFDEEIASIGEAIGQKSFA